MKKLIAVCIGFFALLAGCGAGPNKAASKTAPADKYPLDICVVTGQKLGSMGEPYVVKYQGHTIKFCCSSCLKDFNADTGKYVAMVVDAEKGAK